MIGKQHMSFLASLPPLSTCISLRVRYVFLTCLLRVHSRSIPSHLGNALLKHLSQFLHSILQGGGSGRFFFLQHAFNLTTFHCPGTGLAPSPPLQVLMDLVYIKAHLALASFLSVWSHRLVQQWDVLSLSLFLHISLCLSFSAQITFLSKGFVGSVRDPFHVPVKHL